MRAGDAGAPDGRRSASLHSRTAPLDRAPCLIYSYQVLIDRGSGKKRSIIPIARGVALAPSCIRTATGSHNLLVMPELEALDSQATLQQRIDNFLLYAQHTPFTEGRDSAQELLQCWPMTTAATAAMCASSPPP